MNASADNFNRLGIAHAQRREFRQAAECFRLAVAADPNSVNSYVNLANVIAESGDHQSAREAYQRAIAIQPNTPVLQRNLGVLLTRMGDHAGAVAAYEREAELSPASAETFMCLGLALGQIGRHEQAVSAFRRAAQLVPHHPASHSNLGTALAQVGNSNAALQSLEKALRLKPDFAEAHCNYAITLMHVGRLTESLSHFDTALRLRPTYSAARISRALALLLSGNYRDGLREYDLRIQEKSIVPYRHDIPLWDGSFLGGRTLLLEAEQGVGDTIQFIRYAQEIKQKCDGQIVAAVNPALVPLLTGVAGVDLLIGQSESRPPFDIWVPLLSLPRIMGHDPTCFPASVPYLKADLARVQMWNDRLAGISGLKVGIAWQGNSANPGDWRRSFPLRMCAPLAKLSGVSLISLQKGKGVEQLASETGFQVEALGDDFDTSGGAFLDTAAVMMNLDLVISADTSIAHLAGALERPAWLALAFAPDWRWTMHGERTSAYPTLRLFRQTTPGDWSSVFDHMTQELTALAPQRPPATTDDS